MKKAIFFAALPALMLASCANEESVYTPAAEQAISFSSVASNSSRGYVSSTDTWSAPIYVASAYQQDATSNWSNIYGDNDFVEYTRPNATGYWVSDPVYYYPKNGTINFMAYSTGSNATDPITPDDNGTTLKPTINRAADGTITDIQLSFTTTGHELKGKTEVMYAKSDDVECNSSTPAATALKFHHALSWVSVAVIDGLDQVYVEDIKLDGVYLTGSVKLEADKCTWTTTGDPDSYDIDCFCNGTGSSAKLAKDCTDGDDYLLVVPGASQSITIQYHMASNPDVTIKNTLDISGTTWKASTHYTYNLEISLTGIQFECTVDDYTPTTSQNVPL